MLTIVTIQRLGPDATREEADRLAAFTVAGEPPDEITARVVAGEKGGEVSADKEWWVVKPDALCIAADGRVCRNFSQFKKARARGALPITWYRYEAAKAGEV